ncbi:MAG: endonuclease domain-containing protein [Rhodospirillaceae bacterium]|nr:endonuclease domain-containing protein [Rhodospirillales bacterium]
MLAKARDLRRNQTEAERRLWGLLRAKRYGWKFKRQQVIGPYIVDFVCLECRVIVEADGGQHAESKHDMRRDAWLRSQGFTVVRFWNEEILEHIDGVEQRLAAALVAGAPSPSQR